jgi:hypothetical protein
MKKINFSNIMSRILVRSIAKHVRIYQVLCLDYLTCVQFYFVLLLNMLEFYFKVLLNMLQFYFEVLLNMLEYVKYYV